MQYQIPYSVSNKHTAASLSDIHIDGEIGARFDRFVHERISGKFAIDEILAEALDCFDGQYDDEYAAGMWRGEFWGKQILSACRVCRMKNDDALREAIRRSAYDLIAYQREDGYLSTYRDSDNILPCDTADGIREVGWECFYNWNVWGQKYTLWALIECAQLLDDAYLLSRCVRMADFLVAQIARLGIRVKDAGVMHGMAAGSIMKPMLVLYRLTGKAEYLDFCLSIAKEFDREDGEWPNLIRNAFSDTPPYIWYDAEGGWYSKAYEMMSCYDGIIELYRVTGCERYIDAVKAFWEILYKYESNILGSVGYCERFADGASYADAATEVCDVIHWMRLCYELFLLTGENQYMDAFERAYLNAFLAGVYEDGKTGAFFVRSAGRHWTAEPQVETKYQHCCVNNAARGFVNAAEAAITRDADGYHINLYTPTRVSFGDVSIRISSGYVNRGNHTVVIRGAKPGDRLSLRIPSWSKTVTVRTDLKNMETVSAKAGETLCLMLSKADTVLRMSYDMTPEVIEVACDYMRTGAFCDLPKTDYHHLRWIDSGGGLCDRSVMLSHPMAVIRRGPVMLARSKRLGPTADGCSQEEMFSGVTVYGKGASCTAAVIRHDRLLVGCRVKLTTDAGTYEYVMCDYASAANRDSEDPKFFTMYV